MKQKFLLILPLFIFSFLVLPELVYAGISIPYVVDEKPQVTTTDGVEIVYENKTYYGLENYKQEYVNGYVRFSFTYTHDACCYDGFPPLVHITPTDPRIPQLGALIYPTYYLYYMNRGNGDETDLYFFSIQFDQTGYTIIVTNSSGTQVENHYYSVPELTNESWVALANQHPLSDPPGTGSYAFTPVIVKEPSAQSSLNPVIIIPGIMGSAKKNSELLIDPILHTYDDLIATLEANGYQKEKNLFTFPYEWRDSNVVTANLLKDKISQVQTLCETAKANNEITTELGDTDCSKVDLVAHSMGGLIAREYSQSTGYRRDIDQLIFLGTPHKGAPMAYLIWEGAEFPKNIESNALKIIFGLEALSSGHLDLFDYLHNRPISSVMELLPIFDYIKDKQTGVTRNYPNNYPRNEFLESLNLPRWADDLKDKGINMYNVINSQNPTINKLRVVYLLGGDKWGHGIPDGFYANTNDNGIELGVGDGTVPVASSYNSDLENSEIDNTDHRGIATKASSFVVTTLSKVQDPEIVERWLITKMLTVRLKSPVDMLITAPDGKRLGKDFVTGQEYNEIPGAFYSGYNTHDEYLTIANPLDGEYKIELIGTDDGGKYGVVSSLITDSLATSTTMIGVASPNQKTEIKLDISDPNNPVIVKKIVTPELLIQDVQNAYTLGWIKDKKTRDLLIKQINQAVKFNKKIEKVRERLPDGSTRTKNIEKFSVKMNKILIKLFEKELAVLLKNKKITQEGYDLITDDLNYLINNY